MKVTERLASGKFWMYFWLVVLVLNGVWGFVTMLTPLRSSTVNLNALSVEAIWLACGAGFQSTLSMRKADDKDSL
jgi:hypothetical protein